LVGEDTALYLHKKLGPLLFDQIESGAALFPPSVMAAEDAFYAAQHLNSYGVPLENVTGRAETVIYTFAPFHRSHAEPETEGRLWRRL
jgi:hypothetical protein